MLGRDCVVHREHGEVAPIERHHVRPLARGGGQSQAIRLCANAHGRVHWLLDDLEGFAVSSPHSTASEVARSVPGAAWSGFLPIERSIALNGWEAYGNGFINGMYETAFRLWRTDGTPKEDGVPLFADLGHAARWSKKWRKELDAL
jgi:hypothetical protein